MSAYAPRVAQSQCGSIALAPELRAEFDRRARANLTGLARSLKCSPHVVESLRSGGKGRADTVERVELAFRKLLELGST